MSMEERRGITRRGRTIYLYDDIDNISVCEITAMMHELEKADSDQPIQLIINSEGGYLYDGLALYDKLRNSPCEIQAIGTGLVASMAVIIFLAADVRMLTETARVMIHKARSMLEGNPDEVKIEAKELDQLEELTLSITAERTGQSVRKVRNDIKSGNKYLPAEQAVIEGFASKIIPNKKIAVIQKKKTRTTTKSKTTRKRTK